MRATESKTGSDESSPSFRRAAARSTGAEPIVIDAGMDRRQAIAARPIQARELVPFVFGGGDQHVRVRDHLRLAPDPGYRLGDISGWEMSVLDSRERVGRVHQRCAPRARQ